jgi:uncharacterized damage-inducible protein DinB
MPILTPYKALRSLKKTPMMLDVLLADLSTEQARTLTDGADGWSVLEIMCHLMDLEDIYLMRVRRALAEVKPEYEPVDNDELARLHDYVNQDLFDMFERYVARRLEHLALLTSLREDEWLRRGVHPQSGVMTVLEMAINTALHDIDHIGQIIQALGTSQMRL